MKTKWEYEDEEADDYEWEYESEEEEGAENNDAKVEGQKQGSWNQVERELSSQCIYWDHLDFLTEHAYLSLR